MLHLGPIWYHSEPSDVPYSQNLPRPISWFGLFLQQNDSSEKSFSSSNWKLEYLTEISMHYEINSPLKCVGTIMFLLQMDKSFGVMLKSRRFWKQIPV